MPHVIKVELPPGTNLLVTHGSAESGDPNQDLPGRQPRQRPSRPVDPGYGVEEGGEANQDLPEREHPDRAAIEAKLDEAKKAVTSKIDEIKNRPPATGTPSQDLPNRLEAIKETANAKLDEIKANHPDASVENAKQKLAAKVDEIKAGLGGRVPPDLGHKLDGLKQQVSAAVEEAKKKLEDYRGQAGAGEGNCGAKLDEVKQAVSAKLDEVKQALSSKGADVTNKLEQAKSDLAAKIEEIKASQGDPGYGVDEGSSAEQQPQRQPRAKHF